MLLLIPAVEPKVFAETHLGYELSVCWKVVVKVLRLEIFYSAFKVTDVESYVEICLDKRVCLIDFFPS